MLVDECFLSIMQLTSDESYHTRDSKLLVAVERSSHKV
jgi:hypothetical protein